MGSGCRLRLDAVLFVVLSCASMVIGRHLLQPRHAVIRTAKNPYKTGHVAISRQCERPHVPEKWLSFLTWTHIRCDRVRLCW